MLVNLDQLASIFEVSLPTIRSYIKKGMPYIEEGGQGKPWMVDSADAIQWFIIYKTIEKLKTYKLA